MSRRTTLNLDGSTPPSWKGGKLMNLQPGPREMAFLAKTGLSPARPYDFALANAVLKGMEARLEKQKKISKNTP